MARELLLGPAGGTVSAFLILLLLSLMATMSFRMMMTRRKKAYFSLTFALLLLAAQYVLQAVLGDVGEFGEAGKYILMCLQPISFLTLNIGLYQLYNPTKRKVNFLYWLGVLSALAIAGGHYYASAVWFADLPADVTIAQETGLFLDVWMDIYVFMLILLCFVFITPTVGQPVTYQISLTLYFLTHSADVMNRYFFNNEATAFTFIQHFLPVLFFFIIFRFIFERLLELMQAVYHSAITDGLTGLYNRKFFTRRLQQYVTAHIPVSVIFTDIDNFKKLNDTQGHQRGDDALRQVASIVMEESEEIGIPGRYGGEEIVLLISEPKHDAASVAERIRARVEEEAGVTVSVGWAKYRKGITAEKLLKQADEAMYVSKTTGKNRVTGYKPGMSADSLASPLIPDAAPASAARQKRS